MDNPNETFKVIGKSGFPFQLRVEDEIRSTSSTHQWSIASHENPWNHPEYASSGFIDLVLKHDQIPTLRLAIECKRIRAEDSRQLQWIFLLPNKSQSETELASCLEVEGQNKTGNPRDWKDHRIWDNVRTTPLSLESEFCILIGDDQKKQPILEGIASQLLDSVEGLAQEEISLQLSQLVPAHLRLFIFPTIVTNAEIVVCVFDPSAVNIKDGTLDIGSAELRTVPFIRFRKSLETKFPGGSYRSLRDANAARERTVFVVNATSIQDFLNGWSIQPIGMYATQKITL